MPAVPVCVIYVTDVTPIKTVKLLDGCGVVVSYVVFSMEEEHGQKRISQAVIKLTVGTSIVGYYVVFKDHL